MRKNLLLTTVGDLNHWKTWIEEDREFDIGLIYYEAGVGNEDIGSLIEYWWKKPGFKYPVIKSIVHENPQLLDYDFIWMPDDDIEIKKGSITSLFKIAKELDLDLFQPSIMDLNCYWEITKNVSNSKFRFVTMVEIMCPGFSGSALKRIVKSFDKSFSGWGLEWAWINLLGEPVNKVAVIDSVIAQHMKPCQLEGGKLYQKLMNEKGLHPNDELQKLKKMYPINSKEFANLY